MKLIIWNKANSCSPATYAQRRTIRVNRHGYIYLSGALTPEMELRDGCRLNLANDEQNPKDWYLCRTQQEEGFRLRGDRPGKNAATKRLTGGVEFSNVCLASKLLALAKAECFSVRYLVAKEPVVVDGVKYYKILTANPIPGMPRTPRRNDCPPRYATFGVRVSDPAYHCLRALFPPGNLCAGPEVLCRKHGLAAKTYPGVLARYSPRNIRKRE